jgi:hypothetical protein
MGKNRQIRGYGNGMRIVSPKSHKEVFLPISETFTNKTLSKESLCEDELIENVDFNMNKWILSQKEVKDWDLNDVYIWILEKTHHKIQSKFIYHIPDIFKENHIDGECLLSITEDDYNELMSLTHTSYLIKFHLEKEYLKLQRRHVY